MGFYLMCTFEFILKFIYDKGMIDPEINIKCLVSLWKRDCEYSYPIHQECFASAESEH